MRNKITQIIATGLLLVSFWGNGQENYLQKQKNKLHTKKYYKNLGHSDLWYENMLFKESIKNKSIEEKLKLINEKKINEFNFRLDTIIEKSDFIFEAENILDSNSKMCFYNYEIKNEDFFIYSSRKLFITKIYKGFKNISLGTINMVIKIVNNGQLGKYSQTSNTEKHIYFAKIINSNFSENKEKFDNSLILKSSEIYISEFTDTLNRKCFRAEQIIPSWGFPEYGAVNSKYFLNIEKDLLKGRKNVKINGERKESIVQKKTTKRLQIDTAIFSKKDKKRKADSVFRWQDINQIDKDYKQYKIDSAANPEKIIKFAPAWYLKKMGVKPKSQIRKSNTNARTEAISSAYTATFSVKNMRTTKSNVTGKNYVEFDVTMQTDGTSTFHTSSLFRFSYNKLLFGANIANTPKLLLQKGDYFSNPLNNYDLSIQNVTDGVIAISLQAQGINNTSTYNRVVLLTNTEHTLFKVAMEYDWANKCGMATQINYTDTFITEFISSFYALNATTDGGGDSFGTIVYTPFTSPAIPPCNPQITSIEHYNKNGILLSSARGGTDDYIKIKGNGFGAIKVSGTSKVEFKNANDGGNTLVEPDDMDYINWTETEINLKVPSLSKNDKGAAGSGVIKITNDLNNTQNSPSNIKVDIKYSIINFKDFDDGNIKKKQNLIKFNCINGLEFNLSSSIENHSNKSDIIACIDQAMLDWQNYLGIDVKYKKNTNNTPIYSPVNIYNRNDNVNIITIGSYSELSLGSIMGNLITINDIKFENTNSGRQMYKFNNDILIKESVVWDFTVTNNNSNTNDNFFIAIRHEIGHALGLAHVIDDNEMMHYLATQGKTYSITSGNGMAGLGALDIKTASQNIVWAPSFNSNNIGNLGATTPNVTISSSLGNVLCNGQTSTLSLNIIDPIKLQWYKNNAPISGGNFGTYDINSSGSYSLVMGKNGCTTTSNVITITQPNLTSPTITTSKLNLCNALDNATLTTSAPFSSYTWRKNNAIIPNSNFNSFNINTIGNYDLIGSTNGCTTTSNVVTITQIPTPTPVIFSNFPTSTICALSAQLNSNPNCNNCQWRNNGINIPANQGGNTVFLNFSTAGRYDLLGTINGCPVVSNVLTITQIGRPVLNTNVVYSAVPNCIGTISVTSNSSNTYKWYFPNNNTYYLSAANMFTGQTSPTFVAALANIQLPWRVDATNCAGTTTTFIPVNANTAYLPSATSIVNYTTLGSCQAQIQLTSNNSISYQWFAPNSSTAISGATSTSLTAPLSNVAGNYTARLTNACGSTDVAIPVATQIDKKPAVSITLTNIPNQGSTCISSGSLLANVTNGFSSLVFMKGGNSPIGTANANPVITSIHLSAIAL